MSKQPPEFIGPYRILDLLGRGGMGEVYRALDTRLDRKVAIKILPNHLASDASAMKLLRREAKAIARLNHPNILAIYEFDTTNTISFVVTELLEGETLGMRLNREPLEINRAIELAIAVAEGLSAAHSKGVIHRDLKPENIFLTSDGRVKILDFGLARLVPSMSEHEMSQSSTKSLETGVGTVRGTVPYMSPEQLRGDTVDIRTDIFSFGCVLYEMLTGGKAFQRNSNHETIGAILHKEPIPLNEQVPAPLHKIVSRCLKKDCNQRFASAEELLGALKMATTLTEPAQRAIRRPFRKLAYIAAALVLFAIVAGFLWKTRKLASGGSEKIGSLAVLPLQNLSGNVNQEYFVDGMTDELISELSKIRSLKVISRTSSMQYKEAKKHLPEIARDLHVDALVEGSVVREGDQVRITVQLIHGSADQLLWSKSYERQIHGVLMLQGEVAQAIAQEIQAQLTPQEQKLLSATRSVNSQAHETYLKAMYYFHNTNTVDENQKGFRLIQQAAALDPHDALIQSTLARFYLVYGEWSILPSTEAYTKANEAALRAVELDDNLARAHQILGRVYHQYSWNQAAAKAEYMRAIELQPNDAEIHGEYAWYLCRVGHSNDALAEAKIARELDPLNLDRIFDIGKILHYSRRYEEALTEYRKVLELLPERLEFRYQLVRLYLAMGKFESAISEVKQLQAADPSDPLNRPLLGVAYGFSGKKEEARKILEDLKEKRKHTFVRPFMIAELHNSLSEKDQTLAWLERACDERDDWVVYLHVDPLSDPLRSEPRFKAILKRVGLPTN